MVRLSPFTCGLLAILIPCSAFGDQILLKNGDRITGAIVRKDGNKLVIKTDLLGEVTAPWDKVESVTSEKALYVVTKEGKTISGPVSTVNGSVEVGATPKSTFAPADITAIRNDAEQKAFDRLQHPAWTQLWAGTGTLGFAGTSGNAETLTFTMGATAQRVTLTDKTSLYFNAIQATASANGKSSPTAEAVRGGFSYNHNIGSRLFLSGFNDYEYDKFQNLDLRFVVGGGFGFHALKGDRQRLDLVGGGDFNHSAYSTPLTQKTAEGYFGDDYSRKIIGGASLTQSLRIFDDLQDGGAYRLNFDTGTSFKLRKWLNWNISLSDRYVNHPAAGRKTNDFLYTTGVGITFAR